MTITPVVHLHLLAQHPPFHAIVLSMPGEIVGGGPRIGSTLELCCNGEGKNWTIQAVTSSLEPDWNGILLAPAQSVN